MRLQNIIPWTQTVLMQSRAAHCTYLSGSSSFSITLWMPLIEIKVVLISSEKQWNYKAMRLQNIIPWTQTDWYSQEPSIALAYLNLEVFQLLYGYINWNKHSSDVIWEMVKIWGCEIIKIIPWTHSILIQSRVVRCTSESESWSPSNTFWTPLIEMSAVWISS